MRAFKEGDTLKVVDPTASGCCSIAGALVEVSHYEDHYVHLKDVVGGWHEDRFELVNRRGIAKERDPNGLDANAPGAKLDAGKLRPTLVLRDMARALTAVIKIASDGAVKYTPGGWLVVTNGLERYEDADLRHMLKRFVGQPVDADSNSLHLAHEAWNALAKLELALRAEEAV